MSVMVAEDRSMCVQPYQVVQTAWVDIDLCQLGCRVQMSPEAVEKKYRRLLNLGDCAPARRSLATGRVSASWWTMAGTTSWQLSCLAARRYSSAGSPTFAHRPSCRLSA